MRPRCGRPRLRSSAPAAPAARQRGPDRGCPPGPRRARVGPRGDRGHPGVGHRQRAQVSTRGRISSTVLEAYEVRETHCRRSRRGACCRVAAEADAKPKRRTRKKATARSDQRFPGARTKVRAPRLVEARRHRPHLCSGSCPGYRPSARRSTSGFEVVGYTAGASHVEPSAQTGPRSPTATSAVLAVFAEDATPVATWLSAGPRALARWASRPNVHRTATPRRARESRGRTSPPWRPTTSFGRCGALQVRSTRSVMRWPTACHCRGDGLRARCKVVSAGHERFSGRCCRPRTVSRRSGRDGSSVGWRRCGCRRLVAGRSTVNHVASPSLEI